jgi:light-regulated signal transduction histidine kinase (bacteriophytochrome)
LGGQKHFITSERQQILDLLISTYETAVQKNDELIKAQQELQVLNERLEEIVQERTAALTLEIEERKRAEAEVLRLNAELEQRVVQRTTELEAANHELEAFSYSVSHDLRAPLRAINGFSQAIIEDEAGQLSEDGQRSFQRIVAAAHNMGELIDGLLALSRVARAEIRRETVNMSALAESVTAELRRTQPDRQVTVEIAPGLVAQGDARLLRVVLANLLGNAWKFTSRKTSPRIEFGVVSPPEGAPVYFVGDDGAGFDQAYAGKLFGAFQRMHAASDYEGTGIGLATVQRIIQRHGGRVWAEGVVNAGAKFYFTLGAS